MGRKPKSADEKFVNLTIRVHPLLAARLRDEVELREIYHRPKPNPRPWTISRIARQILGEAFQVGEDGHDEGREDLGYPRKGPRRAY